MILKIQEINFFLQYRKIQVGWMPCWIVFFSIYQPQSWNATLMKTSKFLRSTWIFCYYSFKTPLTAGRLTFGEHFLFLIYNGRKWHSREPFPAIVTYCQKKKKDHVEWQPQPGLYNHCICHKRNLTDKAQRPRHRLRPCPISVTSSKHNHPSFKVIWQGNS